MTRGESPHHRLFEDHRGRRDQGKKGASPRIANNDVQEISMWRHLVRAQGARFAILILFPGPQRDSLDAMYVEASGDEHFAKADNQWPPRKWNLNTGSQDCRIQRLEIDEWR